VTISADQPYADAAAEIIGERSAAVFAHQRKEVLDISEIEGAHDMRVATRRLRAALEVFGPCLDRKRGRRALHEVKALAEALGERRDRDVQLVLLGELHERSEGAERAAVDLLIDELRMEQLDANEKVARALRRVKRKRLAQRLTRLAG
jgi:CHAD domain-containing protein